MTKKEQKVYNKLKKIWTKNTKRLLKIKQINSYREFADYQLNEIDKTRPNKEKTLEENCNEIQLEFIKYLRLVRDTNEL